MLDVYKTRRYRITNDNIKESVGVAYIVEKMVEARLRCFGHVKRSHIDYVLRSIDQIEDSQITKGKRRHER